MSSSEQKRPRKINADRANAINRKRCSFDGYDGEQFRWTTPVDVEPKPVALPGRGRTATK